MVYVYKIDRLLAHIQGKIPFSRLNPTNVKSEEKKVLKNPEYNPSLHYRQLQKNLRPLQDALNKLKIPKTPVGKLLHEKRIELHHQVSLVRSIGTKEFTNHAIAIYDRPSQELVRKAKQLLKLPQEETNGFKVAKITIVKKFLDACLHHKFSCDILEKDMIAAAAVNASKRRIYFKTNHPFTEADLRRLTVHEIGTHIKRGENARHQKLKLFTLGFQGYLSTEEGLAVYNEEKAQVLTPSMVRQYAGRVVAVDLALKNPFNIVYNCLRDYFSDHESFITALRVKRGLKQTGRPGGYPKDHVYLKGLYQVKQFVKKGGKLKDLYVGKIGVEHVPALKHIRRELGE